jgi:hypothetical protein
MRAHAPAFVAPTADSTHLEPAVAAVEARLLALGEALMARDAAAMERCAGELHRALTDAVSRFSLAARSGAAVNPALRQRLMQATGAVAAQRESLSRATAALDRAMDVLMPRSPEAVYRAAPGASAYGSAGRSSRGSVHA